MLFTLKGNSLLSRTGLVFASVLAAFTTLMVAPGPASATVTSCSGFGCDGHDPAIQRWQSGPTHRDGRDHGSGFGVELWTGTTDGDFYAWAKASYPSGSNPYDYTVFVQRCRLDHSMCENLGESRADLLMYDGMDGNIVYKRTGMYYDPAARTARACMRGAGREVCTGWI
ncbi:hypothetical protein AB0I68_38035 [Streptomyces sp. NPDC050448]|uniref:hypothetical protein n=1 Tax=Streptomyces sp. NPDC050448 TaxID=3155404 RepID=UPI0034410533